MRRGKTRRNLPGDRPDFRGVRERAQTQLIGSFQQPFLDRNILKHSYHLALLLWQDRTTMIGSYLLVFLDKIRVNKTFFAIVANLREIPLNGQYIHLRATANFAQTLRHDTGLGNQIR